VCCVWRSDDEVLFLLRNVKKINLASVSGGTEDQWRTSNAKAA
jgi:hypothetical protein